MVYEELKPEEILGNNEDNLVRWAEADEDDKWSIIGTIWGERLKELPADVRHRVKRVINRVFKEARKGTLSNQFSVFESQL